MASSREKAERGPVAQSLRRDSSLRDAVRPGIQALSGKHRRRLDADLRSAFGDSLDLDNALKETFPEDPRWDYLLGYSPSTALIGVEVHPATDGNVREVVEKKKRATEQLRGHLRAGKKVTAWLWVASGKVSLVGTSSKHRLLNQEGVKFVGRALKREHIEDSL